MPTRTVGRGVLAEGREEDALTRTHLGNSSCWSALGEQGDSWSGLGAELSALGAGLELAVSWTRTTSPPEPNLESLPRNSSGSPPLSTLSTSPSTANPLRQTPLS